MSKKSKRNSRKKRKLRNQVEYRKRQAEAQALKVANKLLGKNNLSLGPAAWEKFGGLWANDILAH